MSSGSGLISGCHKITPDASQSRSSAKPPSWVVRTLSTTIGVCVTSSTTLNATAATTGRAKNRNVR